MSAQTLALPLTIPEHPGGREACRARIEESLGNRPGIRGVRVVFAKPQDPVDRHASLELDYDADLLSLRQINGYLRQAGGCLGESIAHMVVRVEGLVTPRQELTVQKLLNRLPGVTASASYSSQMIRLEFDRRRCALPEIVRRLDHLGMRLRSDKDEFGVRAGGTPSAAAVAVSPAAGWWKPMLSQPDWVLVALAGVFLLSGFMVHVAGGPQWLRIVLVVASGVCGGWYPAKETRAVLARWRVNIDVLMFAAAFGAASLGHYEEGALLLFLFSLGGAGERLAMDRARRAIQALARLAPKTATLVTDDGAHRLVKVDDLRPGDRVLIRPGEQVSCDGTVLEGSTSIDQSPITGESVPVDKALGDKVYAGTINGQGGITVRVDRLASDNTLAKVIRMVEEAQTTRSPTQLFTDRIEKWYVPLVLVGTAGIALLPPLLKITPVQEQGSLWSGWFYQAMAFLTAASPCALAIGTPAAVLSGIGRAARAGVLIKGGVHLENLGRVTAIAFDKTGTLTRGRPEVTEVVPVSAGLSEAEVLALAAAVERWSQHPLAEAIVSEAESRDCAVPEAQDIQQTPGVGVQGTVNGRRISVGKLILSGAAGKGNGEQKVVAELEEKGRTTVVVADERGVVGVIGLADQPQASAARMVDDLRRLGIRKTILLTGDNQRTAAAIAQQVGIDEYHGGLLPEDKVRLVKELDRRHGRVAMVGDGVNDAPAMASATVGVAVGGASVGGGASGGSDVALETADVALLAGDLGKLPEAIGVSRFSRRIIVENLVIALGVIVVLAPLAAIGWTPISLAVMFHEGSTVVVVLNALRILGYRAARSGAGERA